jgi:hypothetical protein
MLERFIASITLDILVFFLQQPHNWLCDLGEVWNEPSIITGQLMETPHLGHSRWLLLIQDLFHLAGSTVIPSGETT